MTLLNWVKSKEIQTWRRGSSNPKLSGCVSGNKIVILEYEEGIKSTIRTYKMKQPSTTCSSASGKYCSQNQSIIAACELGNKLETSKMGLDSCPSSCPTRKFDYLGEVCVHCHRDCERCSGKISIFRDQFIFFYFFLIYRIKR